MDLIYQLYFDAQQLNREHLTFVTPKLGFMSSYLESLATT
jgi:hypothetical protein